MTTTTKSPVVTRTVTLADGTIVEAIQLTEGDIPMISTPVWDAVAEFLGMDPNSGRGEHFTIRRPPQYRGGCVEVTLHQNWGSGHQGEAWHNDWLVKFPDGKVHMLTPEAADLLIPDPRPVS